MAKTSAVELAALVADAAAELGLEGAQDGDGMAYSVGTTLVVYVAGATAEFRLRADVAGDDGPSLERTILEVPFHAGMRGKNTDDTDDEG